jgi:hypothetical protein
MISFPQQPADERTWINTEHDGLPYRLRAAWHRLESHIEIQSPDGLEPVPSGWIVGDIPDGEQGIGTRAIEFMARESDRIYPEQGEDDEAPSPANRNRITALACTVARLARWAGLESIANRIVRAEWERLDYTMEPEAGWYDLAARCPWAFEDARGYRNRIARLIQPTRGKT